MSITANHLISDIRNIASSGGNPNEFKITDRQILFWIEETRSMLISQSINKRDDINDSWIQYIGCVEMEQVDNTNCCVVDTECYVLKSKKQIPSTIDSWRDNWIISVTTPNDVSIPKSNPIKQRYNKYNKYTKSDRNWFIKNDYLYVINEDLLEYVSVSGLFEFPSDLGEFTNCDNSSCWDINSNYPISLTLATQVTDIVIKTKVNPFMSYPMDTKNDASGATPQQIIQNKQAD